MGIGKAKAFWEKSLENKQVSDQACRDNHYNAAASRYYYALYLAVFAFFEKKQIPVPRRIRRGKEWVRNPNPKAWPHPELRQKLDEVINGKGLKRIIKKAWNLRIKGDYKDIPVEPDEMVYIRSEADTLFKVCENEITKT